MSYMFELHYNLPHDPKEEGALMEQVTKLGGHLDYREDAGENVGVCLTFEFDDRSQAEKAAALAS